jgi:hypothetical protein
MAMSLFGLGDRNRKDATKIAIRLTQFAPIYFRVIHPLGVAADDYWKDEFVFGFVLGCALSVSLSSGLKDNDPGILIADVFEAHTSMPRQELIQYHASLLAHDNKVFHDAQFKGLDYAAYFLDSSSVEHTFIGEEIRTAEALFDSGQLPSTLGIILPDENIPKDVAIKSAVLDLAFMQTVEKRLLPRTT